MAEGPDYKPTKQIPRVEVPQNTLDAVLTEVRASRAEQQEIRDEVREVRVSVALVTNELNVVKGSVQNLQDWRGIVDDRLKSNSIRVKQGGSEADLKNEATLAMLHTKVDRAEEQRQALATDVADLRKTQAEQTAMISDIKKAVVGFFEDPKVRLLGKLIFSAAMAYAAAKGIKVLP